VKIAIIALDINPPFVGGVANSVISLARALSKMGVKVHILTNSRVNGRKSNNSDPENLDIHNVGFFANARSLQGKIFFSIDLVRCIRYLARKYGIEIFNSHSGYEQFALASSIACKSNRVKVVHTIYSPPNKLYFFKFCDKLFAVSKNIYNILKPYYQNVFYVGNGVDIEKFKPSPKKTRGNEKIILAMGTGRARGVDLLLRALAILRRKIDVKTIIITGGVPVSREELKLAKKLNVEKYVKWLGKVEDTADYYRLADVFVRPLRNTYGIADIPNSILEAYACGIPVVATNVGGISEVVDEFYLVPPNNHFKLAQKLIEVLEQSWNPRFRRLAKRYSWNKIAKKYLEILQND